MRFVTVPGFITAWQSRKNEAGCLVSEVEPITDEKTRHDIKKQLEGEYYVSNVGFW